MGDLVIITLEGDDPAAAFQAMMSEDTEFTRWMNAKIGPIHGIDFSAGGPPPIPRLVVDTRG